MHLQHDSFHFLPLALCSTFWLTHAHFLNEKMTYVFRLFDFWIFFCVFFSSFFCFCCSDWRSIGLTCSWKTSEKHHQDRQFLSRSSQVQWQEILLWVFHSTFWAFLCISQAPLGQSLWSGHHWKDLFLLQKLSIDDANVGQKWWRQKWKKGQGLSQPAQESIFHYISVMQNAVVKIIICKLWKWCQW